MRMPAMMPLPSLLRVPTRESPYWMDGSVQRGSIIVRSCLLPIMPPVPMTMALRARMVMVSARSSMLPSLQKLSRRSPVSGFIRGE